MHYNTETATWKDSTPQIFHELLANRICKQ